ncbi:MAG TPA: nucleotide exchange factor GrpE [Candidatus Saccharimonadales bacterium]
MTDNPKKKISKRAPQSDEEIEALKQQLDELTEALQRERADALNVRRRADEERLKMSSYFKASVIKELLPFIDNFDRALNQIPLDENTKLDKSLEDWLKGLSGVNRQLWSALDAIGVKRIKTVGEEFDPKYHEAVQMDEDSSGAKEIISQEFMSGYTLDDEVIRHAMVKVTMK